jgi:hypothetical protein
MPPTVFARILILLELLDHGRSITEADRAGTTLWTGMTAKVPPKMASIHWMAGP